MSRLVRSNQEGSNMQHSVLNRASIQMADTTDVNGRVTADEMKRLVNIQFADTYTISVSDTSAID